MRPVTLVLAGVALCVVLGVVVLGGSVGPGPLDQPDPADQRNGLLLTGPTVEPSLPGVPPRDGPTVLLFVRSAPQPSVLRQWRDTLPATTHVVLVVQEPGSDPSSEASAAHALNAGADLIGDPDGRLATAVDLPEPVDGGPGVGYAVIDSDRVVRYATLDPRWPENAFELDTIVGAIT